jgi:hypothetical protein
MSGQNNKQHSPRNHSGGADKDKRNRFKKFFNSFGLPPKNEHRKNHSRNKTENPFKENKSGEGDPLFPDQDEEPSPHGRNAPSPEKDLPTLHRHTYNGRDLSSMLRTNAETKIEDKLTGEEYEWLRDLEGNIHTEEGLLEFLDYSISILDKVFFFGIVQEVVQKIELYTVDELLTQGFLVTLRFRGFWNASTNFLHFKRDFHLSEKQFLESLVHEMCHAFLETFACPCRKCSQTVGNVHRIHGATGHGPIFCNAISRIRDDMTRELGWKVDCNIEQSVLMEMKTSQWDPSEKQLVRWHLDHLIDADAKKDRSSSEGEKTHR